MTRTRGPDGRWLKPGAPLPADGSGPPTVITILPALDDPDGAEWGVRRVSVGFAVDLDAGHLVDAGTRALLVHTRTAILSGQRPDGGGEQRPLGRRAAGDPDRESPHRGHRTGELADGLRRTAIVSSGAEASSRVLPPTSRTAYVAKERTRGVVLLTGDGAAGEATAAAAREAARLMTSGRRVEGDQAEVEARDA